MGNNNQSNRLIKWLVMAGDFALLNAVMLAFAQWHWRMHSWPEGRIEIFLLVNNLALLLSEMRFSWQPLCAVSYQAAFASVIAFILFCYTVRQIGVTRANAFNNIRPVFTALIMLCFFGEALPWAKWIAIVLVITGLFICQYQKK